MSGTALFASEAKRIVQELLPSIVVVGENGSYGTGVLWRPDVVITNHHVAHTDRPLIRLSNGDGRTGKVIARDRRNDLAAIQIPETAGPATSIADSRGLQVGQIVLAVGHPLGLLNDASLGILSGTQKASWMGPLRRELLQIDIALAPGNSGGPIVDMNGAIVGIACMVASPGIALAVPSQVVEEFIRRVLLGGRRVA